MVTLILEVFTSGEKLFKNCFYFFIFIFLKEVMILIVRNVKYGITNMKLQTINHKQET